VSGIGGFCDHNQFYIRDRAPHASASAAISEVHAHLTRTQRIQTARVN